MNFQVSHDEIITLYFIASIFSVRMMELSYLLSLKYDIQKLQCTLSSYFAFFCSG